MILLARDVHDGRDDQRSLDAIDIGVRRNAVRPAARQLRGGPRRRRPRGRTPARRVHPCPGRGPGRPGVEVLASSDAGPVLCRSGAIMVCSFHPELGDDRRLHATFLEGV
jgi:5'-phosphate synthase pdxT subunit